MTITPITTGPGDPPQTDDPQKRFNGQLDGAKAAHQETTPAKEEQAPKPQERYVPHGEDVYLDTETGRVVGWPQGNGG